MPRTTTRSANDSGQCHPLVDARFDEGEGPGQTPLAIEVEDIDEERRTPAVVITVFNKYQAAFRAGVAE